MRKHLSMKLILLAIILLSTQTLKEPDHTTSYASLDRRPIPGWFEDSKFGIFIHWGVYSVPGWSPKGSYAEWYQYWLRQKKTHGNIKTASKEVYEYHTEKFGPNNDYYQFGNDFKPDKYRPEDWAKLIQNAGAKYVVLTSKHHDGFALWPSAESDRVWGFHWNSMSAGPKRDIVGELSREVNKTDVKFGIYYSMYEWYNPLYLKRDKSKYVDSYMLPQMRDLINRYEPWIFWTDGQWDQPSRIWKSRPFISWLYNESPVSKKVVINGRWGKEMKPMKGPFVGNFISTENDGVALISSPWEECRGIGLSFGYNRNEDIKDYNTSQTLILLLVDIISHGGNLLLNIGPDERGEIPPIMRDRLSDMGAWLKINGEAIYGTRRWIEPVQWSEGRRTSGVAYKKKHKLAYLEGAFILKQTVNPDPGDAVKEVFFTTKGETIYAILPTWGTNGKVILKDMQLGGHRVTLLETGTVLKARQKGKDIEITLPAFDPNKIKSKHAWVLKL